VRSHFCCSAVSCPVGGLFRSALHVCSPVRSPFVASHLVAGPFGSTSQTRMSMALYQPWPREPLASNPLVGLREPPLLSLRHWHPGRKEVPRPGACARRHRKKAGLCQRCHKMESTNQGRPDAGECESGWLPREAAQGGEGTLEMPLRQRGHECAAPLRKDPGHSRLRGEIVRER
jgi:hypothetical protein